MSDYDMCNAWGCGRRGYDEALQPAAFCRRHMNTLPPALREEVERAWEDAADPWAAMDRSVLKRAKDYLRAWDRDVVATCGGEVGL